MINTFKQQLEVFSKAIDIRNRRNEILASNIANASTPNYKARDVDFETALKSKVGGGDLLRSSDKHYGDIDIATGDTLKYRQNMNPSADGNTVELSVEQMEFSENTVRYMSSLNFLNSRITGLMAAIRGE